jgi:isopenicillin-N N-acyltransferase-like protein
MGLAIGRAAREKISRAVDYYRLVLVEEGLPEGWVLPASYLEAAGEDFPGYVEEIMGMARGSGQDFETLFLLNSLEEALTKPAPSACTSLGLLREGEAYLGHNEDWYREDSHHAILIHGRPRGKPEFVSVTAAPFLPAVGMNECGVAQGINSVSCRDRRPGVPIMFSSRAVLEAENIDEAIARALPPRRAGGYNHLLVSAEGRLGNLETSACQHHFAPADRSTFHTNHYVSAAMAPLEGGPSRSSLSRYSRCRELRETLEVSENPVKAITEILRDHGEYPYSICRHPQGEGLTVMATIFSLVFDVRSFRVWVTEGNPCLGDFQLYTGFG